MSSSTKAIIYDNNCPLCAAYTSAFVSTGLITSNHRIPFCEVNNRLNKLEHPPAIDWNKARHEIPVVDVTTGEVVYGVDALVSVLKQKMPFIATVANAPLLRGFFRKLYKFVSYNRKIIVANPNGMVGDFDCSPDFHLKSRIMLIGLCALLASFNMYITMQSLQWSSNHILPAYVTTAIAMIVTLLLKVKHVQWLADSFAHASIVCFIASLLLMTATMMKNFFAASTLVYVVMITLVVGVVSKQAWQRIQCMLQ